MTLMALGRYDQFKVILNAERKEMTIFGPFPLSEAHYGTRKKIIKEYPHQAFVLPKKDGKPEEYR